MTLASRSSRSRRVLTSRSSRACSAVRRWVTSANARVAEIPSPERAASALAHLCRYAQWRNRPKISSHEPAAIEQLSVVREIVGDRLAETPAGGWLGLDEAARLLSSCGLPILATHAVFSADEAAAVGSPSAFR